MKQHCPNCGGILPPGVLAESVPLRPERELHGTLHEGACACKPPENNSEGSSLRADAPLAALVADRTG